MYHLRIVAFVAKDNVRMQAAVYVANYPRLLGVCSHCILERSRTLGIVRLSAMAVAMVGKVAVAINVNVGEESVVAFDVDGFCLVVLTIVECWSCF